jgi:hypothetical protein
VDDRLQHGGGEAWPQHSLFCSGAKLPESTEVSALLDLLNRTAGGDVPLNLLTVISLNCPETFDTHLRAFRSISELHCLFPRKRQPQALLTRLQLCTIIAGETNSA